MDSLDIAASALSAFGTAQAVTANNIANVNTDGYAPRVTSLETGPDGQGVRVADIYTPSAQGASQSDSQTYPTYQSSGQSSAASSGALSGQDAGVQPSQVDLARETVEMISNERAFDANLTVVRTANEMKGSLFDLMV